MVQDVITGAQMRAQRKKQKRPSRYQTRINENIAIGLYKEQFIRLMLEENKERQNGLFVQLKEDMMKNIVPIRTLPGKPRRWKYFNKYKCNLKPGF
jgi:ribosomal protein S8